MTEHPHVPTARYGVLQQEPAGDEIDLAAERLRRLGYCVLDGGFSPTELGELSEAFDRVHAAYLARHGEQRLTVIDEQNTIRAPLLEGEPWFIRLACWPRVLDLMSRLIVGRFLLNQQNGIINPPGRGYNQGAWHRDLPYQHFVSSRPVALNALFCLDPFRLDNGATYVLPASHLQERFPSEAFVASEAIQVTAPAGSFIVLDAMTFHCGGANRSTQPRRAVNHVYAIPHIRQQIGLSAGLVDDASLTSQQRSLLGLTTEEPRSVDEYLSRRGALR